MPNAKKYKAIKNDPKRYRVYLDGKRSWIKTNRTKFPFTHFSYDFKKRKGVVITPFQFWCIAKKQKMICPLTGRKLDGDCMSVDHILPLSRGGTHDISNLQFVHVDVNYAKRDLTVDEFVKMCQEVSTQALVPHS